MVFRQNCKDEQFENAKNIAIGWSSNRMVSEKQLRTKLRQRGVTDDAVIGKAVRLMNNLVRPLQGSMII